MYIISGVWCICNILKRGRTVDWKSILVQYNELASYYINCTCCKCAIYGQITNSGAMLELNI